MAKKKRRKNPISKVRKQTNYFKAGEAKTLEQYIIASAMTGAFTAIGAVIGTVLAKYLLKEVDNTGILPASLHAAIEKA
jgi:hypothetical protein